MRQVGAFEAKNTLGQLLDLVEQGEEVIITRHGKVVARLVSARPIRSREQARAAIQRIRERAEQRLKEVEDAEADTCVTYCMSCAHRMAGSETRDTVRHILELIFNERVQHREFDARAQALFEGEHGEENCRLLQNSKLLA